MKLIWRKSRLLGSLLLTGTLLLSSCAVPDVQPFATATTEMVSAMRLSQAQTLELWQKAEDNPTFEATTRTDLTKEREKFEKIWKPTEACLNALASYADSLASLAEAGKTGKEAADALLGSVNGVLQAAGTLQIPTGVISLVSALNARVAEARARHSLKEAVVAATEVIDGTGGKAGIADLLKQNFAALEEINASLGTSLDTSTRASRQVLNYYQSLQEEDGRAQQVLTLILRYKTTKIRQQQLSAMKSGQALGEANPEKRAKLRQEAQRELDIIPLLMREEIHALWKIDVPPDDLKRKLLALDPAGVDLEQGVPRERENEFQAQAAAREELLRDYLDKRDLFFLERNKSLASDLQRINPAYQAAKAELDATQQMKRRNIKSVRLSQAALGAWVEAHRSLRVTLETKQRRPSLSQLLLITKELTANLKSLEGGQKA